MKLVFIGIQGSGKGTQGKILEKNYGFEIFETGGALRKLAKEDSDLGRQIKETIEAGKQVSPKMIEDILVDFIENKANSENIIFDGLVRNSGNKASANKILGDYKVVFFDLPREVAEKRLLGRKYNPKTGETFLSTFNYDPTTGDKLETRKDDNEDSIKQRINEFFEKTMPVVEEYKKQGNLITIDANNCIEGVTKELIEKLGLK